VRPATHLFQTRYAFTARSALRKVFSALMSATFPCVHEISREPLNGFAPNSHGRRVWSLARTSLNVKVKGQGHQGQKTALSVLSAVCVRFIFGKTSSASIVCYYNLFCYYNHVFYELD